MATGNHIVKVKNMSTGNRFDQLEAVSEQLEIFSINWKYFSKSFKAVLVKNMSPEKSYNQLEVSNWKFFQSTGNIFQRVLKQI